MTSRRRGLQAVDLARALAVWVGLVVPCAAAPQAPDHRESAAASASTEPRPFLWRIDGEVPSWLFGTIHLPDRKVTDLPPVVEEAFQGAEAVFTEIDMSQTGSPAMFKAMRMPQGKRLRDVAPPALIERLSARLGGDTAVAGVDAIRPWVVSMQVMLGKRGAGQALDLMLWRDAKSEGKEVGALETVEEQLGAFEMLGLDGEVALLRTTLDLLDSYERRGLDLVDEMITAWYAGDTKRMLKFFKEMDGDGVWQKLSRTLLTDRNLRMAEHIDRALLEAPRKKHFFAVGAAHLIGPTNMVDLLRARGYVVTRVPENAANIDEELEQLQREVQDRQTRIDQLRAKKAAPAEAPRRKTG